MPPAKPMIDDIELRLVQRIDAEEDQALVQHSVPALDGDFLQRLGRHSTHVRLAGVMTGPSAGEDLETLHQKFRDAEPVSFVADIAAATEVDQVLIAQMRVRELAGKPERFEYSLTLNEFIPPPPVQTEEPPPSPVDEEVAQEAEQQTTETVEDIAENVGELRIVVELSDPAQDFSNLFVHVEGTTEAGEEVFLDLEEQVDGVYSRQNVPPGEYNVSLFRR